MSAEPRPARPEPLHRPVLVALLLASAVAPATEADRGKLVEIRTYSSPSDTFRLTVDPRWTEDRRMRPLLTLTRGGGEVLWERGPDDFEEFAFPMHAAVSDDGRYLVFGGYSVHNLGQYREGLRFYDAEGRLIRYYSRRDLPPGSYSVSTAHWYDARRSRLEGGRFLLYTPERDSPLAFAVETGEVLEGSIVPGQGDDDEPWRRRWRKRSEER